MPLDIVTVPCRADNYAFLIHAPESGRTALVDAPETAPLEHALSAHGWTLDEIWITHHHADHVEAVDPLRRAFGATVTGAKADAHRLPALDRAVGDGDTFDFEGHAVTVMDVSGHTVGHVAFHIPSADAVFTADSLMALGCGRVFEGTHEQMWASLSKLAALPPETTVYSGHEYTDTNARFARTIEPDNPALMSRLEAIAAARAAGKPTVPSTLAEELATNPFLRAGHADVKAAIGLPGARDEEAFAEVRRRKDRF
ncbi:MAG: hydroxyacylglutathione hydrolase [Pseudomonadota bacterium]